MPQYDQSQVTPEQLNQLVAYIRSLRKGQTPDTNQWFPPPVGAPPDRTQSPKPGGK